MKTILITLLLISATCFSQSDSLRYKKQYEDGFLTKEDYQFLLRGLAELSKMKKETMDYIIYEKRKRTFIDNLKQMLNYECPLVN